MRTARMRLDTHELAYYHCMGRVSGEPGDLPFGPVERERLFTLLEELLAFYTVEVVSFVVMSNHWHMVCAARPEPPSPAEAMRRWRAHYGPDAEEPAWEEPGVLERVAGRMRDISRLMKDLQQRFTCWYNRTRTAGRRGTLWAGRFKSVLIERGQALWECVKYVEMNPVRAGLCATPEEYRFGSWGRMAGSGRHPFADNFTAHMGACLGERAAGWDAARVAAEFGASLARQAAAEAGASSEDIRKAGGRAKARPRFRIVVMRRARHWADGAAIGSKAFLLEVMARFQAWRTHKCFDASDLPAILSYRQLQT